MPCCRSTDAIGPAGAAIVLAAVVAAAVSASGARQVTPSDSTMHATLVVLNARVWTGDPERPWAEAFAVDGNRFVAVGTTAAIKRHARPRGGARPPEVIDAAGRLVVPGFVDAHVHFLVGGARLGGVQLRSARSRAEFVERLRAYAATVPEGTWITGGDWDHEAWGGEVPTREWIDAVTPAHPVWVNRLDGHMALANAVALAAAGLTRDMPPVEGGTIDRLPSGAPSGLLRDNAMSLVERVVAPLSPAQLDAALEAAMQHVARQGVTSVHHMGDFDDLEVFARAHAAGRLRTRIYAAVPLSQWARLRDYIASGRLGADGRGDDWLRVGLLKGFVDGSLGSHTAAFHDPFTDAPADRGLLVNSEADLHGWIAAADRASLQVAVHAIGDRANGLLLDIYERVAREHGPRDRRFRVEHAQHLAPGDIGRFKALDVIASMQPYHAIDDGRWAERVIGPERAKTTYAFRSLLDSGARLAFGSDWYVAPPTPLEGIYAAVTRRTLDEARPDGWIPEQKIGVAEALHAYTTGAAYASFEQHRKGRIAEDLLADFVVVDRNLLEIPAGQLRQAAVVTTVVGGRKVYQR
jgi:hypothetical protein